MAAEKNMTNENDIFKYFKIMNTSLMGLNIRPSSLRGHAFLDSLLSNSVILEMLTGKIIFRLISIGSSDSTMLSNFTASLLESMIFVYKLRINYYK